MGHVVSREGVSTDPDKITVVKEWPQPTTVTEVRSFLGFVNYYRRFIPNFSKVAKPLNKLLQNLEGTPVRRKSSRFTEVQNNRKLLRLCKSFAQSLPSWPMLNLRLLLSSTLLLVGMGLGAVLYQVQDGHKRVIAYASRSLSKVKGIIQFTNWNSLHVNGPSQINSMSICIVLNFRSLQTTSPRPMF